MESRRITHEALCLSDAKLVEYKEGSILPDAKDAVTSHLALCDACLMRLEMLPASTAEYAAGVKAIEDDTEPAPIPDSLRQALEKLKARAETIRSRRVGLDEVLDGDGLRVGQLWRPKSADIVVPISGREEHHTVFDLGSKPCFVVVTDGDIEEVGDYHVIGVAIVVTDVDAAQIGAGDILVEDSELLAHPFVIQSWNRTEMLRENLDYCVGTVEDVLSEEDYALLFDRAGDHQQGSQYSLEAVVKRGEYSSSLSRYRARAFEDAAYLRFPVVRLRESTGSDNWRSGFPYVTIQTGFMSSRVAYAADKPQEHVKSFSVDGTPLTGVLERDAGSMWLRLQTDDKSWDGALVACTWKPHSAGGSGAHSRYMILSRDDISFDAYVAEMNLGEPDEFEFKPTTVPLPVGSLTARRNQIIRESILDARTPRDLRAWQRLTGEQSLPPDVRRAIEEAIKTRSNT
jgi:hypothetical protein